MRIAFMVNSVTTELPAYTTTRLAMQATNMGHEVWYIAAADFAFDTDDKIHAHAWSPQKRTYKSFETYLEAACGPKARREYITIEDLDALMLRSDPSQDIRSRPWAALAGVNFGQIALRRGVIVLNDPAGLLTASNKMYLEFFPEEVRPKTLVSRDRNEIKSFVRDQGGKAVLKPVQGSGGQSVFLVHPEDKGNLNQMIDAVSRDGYVIAQEYLPAAHDGDTRLFLLNGQPFRYKGRYCAFRRVRSGEDIRSNIHAGGTKAEAEITERELRVAEIVRPKLVQDGMFLVGLDIVGDKLMEINVFSPGGLGSARTFEKVNFELAVIEAIERKVDYMSYYGRNFANQEIATL